MNWTDITPIYIRANIKGHRVAAGQRSQTPYSCFNALVVSIYSAANTYIYSCKYINRSAVETAAFSTSLQPTCNRTARVMHHQLQVRGLHITPDSSEKVHLSTVSGATTDSVPCCVMLHGGHETLVGTACARRTQFEPGLTRSHTTQMG